MLSSIVQEATGSSSWVRDLVAFTIVGIVTGSIYAIAASGLVVTYTTSGVFNFAHGAIGMVSAFLYWQVKEDWGWGTWPALILVLLVFAPVFGLFLERVLMRPLVGKPTGVSLVVTVGLLVLLYGIASRVWPGTEIRRTDEFLANTRFDLAGVSVSAHQVIVLLVTVAVAAGLRLVLFRSRAGVAMRAVVDNPELAELNGALPERVSQMAWVMGVMMAALAGVLIAAGAPSYNHLFLTLLVVNGYAAAILGRLRSLPLTFVGALLLGIGEAYLIGYSPRFSFGEGILGAGGLLAELQPVFTTVFLFAVIVLMPQSRLQVGRLAGAKVPRVPGLRSSLLRGAIFVAAATVVSTLLSETRLFDASTGLVVAMVMLSLVVLVGYSGQISLCQYTFVGVGASVMGKYFASGSLFGLVAATVVAAGFGALVALPALRLRDIYLALVTVAFALFGERLLFDHPKVFDRGATLTLGRPSFLGIDLSGEQAMFIFLSVCFAAMALLVLAIRRGSLGRRLAAMNDSPAACMTLGLNLIRTKVTVFAISAGMAGFAGGVFGMLRTSVSANDFVLFISLNTFLLAMIGGITTVTGALIGGMVLPFLNPNLQGMFIGVGAIVVSRLPNGFAGILYGLLERFRRSPEARAVSVGDDGAMDAPAVAEAVLA